MTDFNALPLAEKIKQAQAGDIVVTDSGARVPVFLFRDGYMLLDFYGGNSICIHAYDYGHITDIIRPTERKVPEVVEWLREEMEEIASMKDKHYPLDICPLSRFYELLRVLADHFEKETP